MKKIEKEQFKMNRKNEKKHGFGKTVLTVSAYALSAMMFLETMTTTLPAYAADDKDIAAVTISVEDTEAKLISENVLTGAFESAKSLKLTKKRRKLFKKAFKGFVGSDITPVAYLASQFVAGTNHLYLCRIKAVVPDAQEYYCFVSIYEDLEGNVSINDIINTETETGINGLMGGWSQASDVKVTKSIKKALSKAFENRLGVSYKPIAVLAEQVVRGMNYCVLCESSVVYPGAPKGYSLVYLYVDFDGSSKITDIIPLKDSNDGDAADTEAEDPEYSMKTVIVSVSSDASQKKVKKIFKKLGLSILYDYENFDMYAVSLEEETDEKGLAELIEKLEAYDEILTAERDYISHID